MGGFLLGLAVAMLINLVTALFSRKHALRLIPWVALYIALHGTYVFLTSNIVWGYSMALAQRFHSHWSYVAVVLIFAIIGGTYWFLIQSATQRLATATAPHETPGGQQPIQPIPEVQNQPKKSGHSVTETKAQVPPITSAEKQHPKTSVPKAVHPADAQAAQDETPPTLLELFKKDFPSVMKASDDAISIKWADGRTLAIKRQWYLDFDAKTKFVGFYIPASDPTSSTETFKACMILNESNAVQQALDDVEKKIAVSGGYGDQMTSIQELTFSGRVLIYHDAFLSITEKADIIRAYAVKHYDVQFRGPDYLANQVIGWHRDHNTKAKPQP